MPPAGHARHRHAAQLVVHAVLYSPEPQRYTLAGLYILVTWRYALAVHLGNTPWRAPGSRYTGRTGSSSRFRKMASATTGPLHVRKAEAMEGEGAFGVPPLPMPTAAALLLLRPTAVCNQSSCWTASR